MVGVDVFPMEKVSFLGDMFVSLHYAIPPPVSAIFGNSHGFQLPKGCFYGLNRWEETSGNFRIFTNEQKIYLKFKNCWFLWEKNTSNSRLIRLVVDKKEENSPEIHCFVFLKTPSTGGKPKKNPQSFPMFGTKNDLEVVDAQSGSFLAWWGVESLGDGFKVFIFSSLPGKWCIFISIFQMGWNHQLDIYIYIYIYIHYTYIQIYGLGVAKTLGPKWVNNLVISMKGPRFYPSWNPLV